jgi:hypothetical protein
MHRVIRVWVNWMSALPPVDVQGISPHAFERRQFRRESRADSHRE